MTDAGVAAVPAGGLRVLQRVVLPDGDDLDVLPLYVETDLERGAGLAERETTPTAVTNAVLGTAPSAVRLTAPRAGGARRGVTVSAGGRASFATYFNAFPASYWRRWTVVGSVVLRVTVSGDATVVVYRSNARGRSHPVHTATVSSPDPQTVSVPLPLAPFIDGGWYWFDVLAGTADAVLVEADWSADAGDRPQGSVSIGITTYNRPGFVVDLLAALGRADDVLEIVDAVYVVDQGSEHPRDHPDFDRSVKGLGDRFTLVEQANLGGSGGFSRAMAETLAAGASDHVLLLDDDVVLEPEGIARAVTFADLARRPTLVGGHMFSLHDRSVLNAFGETVAPYRFWWGAAPNTEADHDFGRQALRHTPWLHRRVDADYNGWWMCLIPVSVVAELGLSVPAFIKWDDAEYGLRAQAAGYPTVSLPGAAVWHVPWHDKNDAVDWQAYYHLRNRLIAALLHSPYERGGRLPAESLELQVQHLLSMQYSTAALRIAALEDVLRGPQHLHRQLPTTNARLAGLRRRFPDAAAEPDVDAFPPVRRLRPATKDRERSAPSNPLTLAARAALGLVRQAAPVRPGAAERPDLTLAHQDAVWWRLTGIDSALVSAPDGTTTAWYRRDPRVFRDLARRSATLHAALVREWPRLAADYRAALPELTSVEAWRHTFAGGPPA